MTVDVTQREALTHLGASTAEAVARVLEIFVPGEIERGDVSVILEGQSAFANLPVGGVAASIAYVNGVTGANVFLMPAACGRTLATAMGVANPEGEPAAPQLTELEMSAIGEAANQMLAAAAAAISVVIGQEIEISPPDVRVLGSRLEAQEFYGSAPYACSTSFRIAGEPCRLVQLVPSAFVVRMARAIDELNAESGGSLEDGGRYGRNADGSESPVSLTEALGEINLRVWAELGRTHMALGQALELPIGAVVELDRAADAPVDLFVNGLCFGHGSLLVTDDGEWAIEVQALAKPSVRKPAPVGGAGLAEALDTTKGTN